MRDVSTGRRPSRKRPLTLLAASAVAALAFLGAGALPANAATNVNIDVYTMNDFHGRLETTTSGGVVTTAGAASIATAYKTLHAANPNSTLVSAGDNVGASTFTSLVQKDKPTIDALNEIGLSASVVGNHELDYGRDDLDNRIIPSANWKYITSNLFEKGTNTHAYAPYDIQTFDGVRIAFVGATTEALPTLVSPAGIATLDVAPIVSSVNDVITGLKASNAADVYMVLMHEGGLPSEINAASHTVDGTTVLGKIVNGVGANADAFITGHTHQLYSGDIDVTTSGVTKRVPVLQTGSYGTNLGHIALTVDKDTKKISTIHGETIPLLSGGKQVYPDDPTVAKTVADAVAFAKTAGSVSIGTITADLKRGINNSPDASGKNENRGAESTIGNLVADAQLAATKGDLGAQIAFMNPGGIRQDILYKSAGAGDPDGNVTYAEAATVQPFANTLVTETLTGAAIKNVLEQQWSHPESKAGAGDGRPTNLHLGISKNLSYTYDPTAAYGSRITTIYLDGKPISATDSFKIVTNSFLASGGDGFLALNGKGQADSGRIDLNAFVDYMKANSPVSPDYATRSIGVVNKTPNAAISTVSAKGAKIGQSLVVNTAGGRVASDPSRPTISAASAKSATVPGDQLSFDLSSLDVNNAAVQDANVITKIDGVQVASTPIDHSIVDSLDEQGRASVVFTVPASTTGGDHTLTFSLPTTGVSLSYRLTVTADGVVVTPPVNNGGSTPTTPVKSLADTKLANTGSDIGTMAPALSAALAALLLGAGLIGARMVTRRRKDESL